MNKLLSLEVFLRCNHSMSPLYWIAEVSAMKNWEKMKKKTLKLFLQFEPVSKVLLKYGSLTVSILFLTSSVLLRFFVSAFPDYETAFYWCEQIALLGKELLGVFYVPVLFFELILILIGMKKNI